MIKKSLSKAKVFYEKYERKLGISFMALGFIIDNLTFRRIDLLFENIILFSYLILALLTILLINAYQSNRLQFSWMHSLHPWFHLPMQYAFGALFSGYVVFYSRSASFIASWPFLLMLAVLLLGNELARTRYAKFTYHISILYIAFFSFTIFWIPVVTKRIGADMFLLSGVMSIVGIAGVLFVIRGFSRERFKLYKHGVFSSIGTIYIVFNVLYFANIIPPIPLALKSIGIYHDIKRVNNSLQGSAEAKPWYLFFSETNGVFHRNNNEPVYVYSAVFAPTDLSTRIYHQWFWLDEQNDRWTSKDRLSFPITGGRDGGYRGYSRKSSMEAGRWRVDVVTERNQLIGRIKFRVEEVDSPSQSMAIELP